MGRFVYLIMILQSYCHKIPSSATVFLPLDCFSTHALLWLRSLGGWRIAHISPAKFLSAWSTQLFLVPIVVTLQLSVFDWWSRRLSDAVFPSSVKGGWGSEGY